MEKRTRKALVHCACGVLAAAVLLCGSRAGAQPTNDNSAPSYDSFNIISMRNIFDPNRRGIHRYEGPRPSYHTTDAFALVGTMSYSKGKFAFFNGTNPDYKKVLEPGANIAGYTIKDISPKDVTLAANGKDLTMAVGAQMRNEGGTTGWQLSTQTDLSSSSDQTTEPSAALTPPTGASPAMSEVLKRLAEQKQQLLNSK